MISVRYDTFAIHVIPSIYDSMHADSIHVICLLFVFHIIFFFFARTDICEVAIVWMFSFLLLLFRIILNRFLNLLLRSFANTTEKKSSPLVCSISGPFTYVYRTYIDVCICFLYHQQHIYVYTHIGHLLNSILKVSFSSPRISWRQRHNFKVFFFSCDFRKPLSCYKFRNMQHWLTLCKPLCFHFISFFHVRNIHMWDKCSGHIWCAHYCQIFNNHFSDNIPLHTKKPTTITKIFL